MNCNIVMTGVGGQGALLAARILGEVSQNIGIDCKISEVHGMAQRGGSVVTFVRMGKKINSPVIDAGDADIILAFELLEAARIKHYLKRNGHALMIAHRGKIKPADAETYPVGIENALNEINCVLIDATGAGNRFTVNTALLGVLCRRADMNIDDFLHAIKACVRSDKYEMNEAAFMWGYNQATEEFKK